MHLRTPNLIFVLLLVTGLAAGRGRAQPPPATAPRAQTDFVVDFWHSEQGLPHNTVTALLQTRDRYLWVGTAAGLARFDGLAFTRLPDEVAPGLGMARITALLEDRDGGLWIGTQGRGLIRLRDGAATPYAEVDGQPEPDVTSLAEDAAGDIWVGTQGGLCRWSAGRISRFVSDTMPPGEPILALHAGRSGTLWVTTRQAVYQVVEDRASPFDLENLPPGRNADFIGVYEDSAADLWTFGATFLLNLSHEVRINHFPSLDPASSRVWTLCEQEDGAFWIGTSGRGLFQFREGRFEIVGVGQGLDQCDVRALHTDDEGNLWIGTNGSGLARLRTRPWRRWGRDEGLDTGRVTALTQDAAGRLVVGTADAGVLVLRERGFEPLAAGPPLGYATRIQALCRDGEGGIWIAAGGVGLLRVSQGRQWQFTTADGLGDQDVRALAAEPDGVAVWAGTGAGTLHRFSASRCRTWTEADGLTGHPIMCLQVDGAGDLWIGSERGGLVRWNGRELVAEPSPDALSDFPLRCWYEDPSGRIWVGTDGGGVYCRSDRGWVGLGTTNGLLSDHVGAVHQDVSGRYWFSSDQGLFQVPAGSMKEWLAGTTGAVTSLRAVQDDGGASRPGDPAWSGALASLNHRLWLAANPGLIALDPAQVRPAIPPRVVIERVLVNGVDVPVGMLQDPSHPGRLDPGVKSLDVHFAAVTFSAPERTHFRHRLAGGDPDWSAPETGRRAQYGPLPPGRYRFEVRATSADGALSPAGADLAWIVARPLWLSWWFLLTTGVSTIAAIWSAVHFVSLRQLRTQLRRSEQRRAMERERSRIARDMHDEIGSKLTRISFLSEVACRSDVQGGEGASPVKAIAHTSRELLQALDEIVWVVNPRNDHLTSLAGYLEEYAYQYFQDTPVACEVSVDPAVGEAPLPAELRHNVFLAFEEALGNVLKHAQAQRVEIRMQQAGDWFEIAVSDDGSGLGDQVLAHRPGHDGLQNMKQRLEAAGGDCTIAGGPERGTRVQFRIPLRASADWRTD